MLLIVSLTHSELPISIVTRLAASISHHPVASISRTTIQVVRRSFMVLAPERLLQESVLSSRAVPSISSVAVRHIPSRVKPSRRLMDAGMPTERPLIGTPSEESMRTAMS